MSHMLKCHVQWSSELFSCGQGLFLVCTMSPLYFISFHLTNLFSAFRMWLNSASFWNFGGWPACCRNTNCKRDMPDRPARAWGEIESIYLFPIPAAYFIWVFMSFRICILWGGCPSETKTIIPVFQSTLPSTTMYLSFLAHRDTLLCRSGGPL
jgi:hypothetical protein